MKLKILFILITSSVAFYSLGATYADKSRGIYKHGPKFKKKLNYYNIIGISK